MIEEAIHENRRKIFTGRLVFLLYVAVYSCAIFIPLSYIFVKEAGALGLVAILVSLALWVMMLALIFCNNADIVRRATGAVPLEEGRFPHLSSAAEEIAIASGQEVSYLMIPSAIARIDNIGKEGRLPPEQGMQKQDKPPGLRGWAAIRWKLRRTKGEIFFKKRR